MSNQFAHHCICTADELTDTGIPFLSLPDIWKIILPRFAHSWRSDGFRDPH